MKAGHKVAVLTWEGNQNPRKLPTAVYHHDMLKNLGPTGPYYNYTELGASAARVAQEFAQNGEAPDVVFGSLNWGETLFLKEVWPQARHLGYAEFFYGPKGRDAGFDPEFSQTSLSSDIRTITHSGHLLLGAMRSDALLSPTRWQASTFPPEVQSKMSVIHDGIDTTAIAPNPAATYQVPDGPLLKVGDEILTFVSRNLEPYRGYHTLMRALPKLMAARPDLQVVMVGSHGVGYGPGPGKDESGNDRSWKQIFLDEVKEDVDQSRIHFVGRVPYSDLLNVLRIGRAHAYLSYPFVLSWSMLEAMSLGCVVVGSNTAPVAEAIEDGVTGHLVDFFDAEAWADKLIEVLSDPKAQDPIRIAARASIIENYDFQTVCLPKLLNFIETAPHNSKGSQQGVRSIDERLESSPRAPVRAVEKPTGNSAIVTGDYKNPEKDGEIAKLLKRGLGELANGEITLAYETASDANNEAMSDKERADYNYLILACAMYYKGDLTRANALNAQLPFTFHAAMRYRLALRQRDPLLAKRIRQTVGHRENTVRDFGWSACLACLWSGKLRMGLPLYHKRIGAQNFGKFLPKGLIYDPFNGGTEHSIVFLEQGVGDILIHLMALKNLRRIPELILIGEPRYRDLIARYFPAATYIARNAVPTDLVGKKAHASGDYLVEAFRQNSSFAPKTVFDAPTAAHAAVIGVCWRGGSGQNRREERRIPLQFFLDQLPRDGLYVALQFDITDAEKEMLRADGRVQMPMIDIRRDMLGFVDLVRQLAGVISVDSTNVHVAGMVGVPVFVLMNKTVHWYWRKDGQVSSVYSDAETHFHANMPRAPLTRWVKRQIRAHKARILPAPSLIKGEQRPILITGVPRSGTSMIAGVLAQSGLWMGKTIPPTRENAKGFFENRGIREEIIKPALITANSDPLGVRSLPSLDRIPLYPTLRQDVMAHLKAEGHDGGRNWAYKEPKLSLLWPQWLHAFPEALWVIVRRDPAAIAQSCARTSFMARHSHDPAYWRWFVNVYNQRLDALAKSTAHVVVVDADKLVQGETRQIKRAIIEAGLNWRAENVEDFVDPTLMSSAG